MKVNFAITFFFISATICLHAQERGSDTPTSPKSRPLKYLSVGSAFDTIYQTACSDSLFLEASSYDKKLETIGNYQLHLIRLNYGQISKISCLRNEQFQKLDYLFLVDPKSSPAYVLVVSYEFLSDSEVYFMNFKIKGSQILLTESAFTEGDDGAEQLLKRKCVVKILKNGKFEIKQ